MMTASTARPALREQDEVERLRVHVDQLEMSLMVARREIEQAERSRSKLRGMLNLVSYEMRSPLGALRLQLDRLSRQAREALGSHASELSGPCLRSVRRLLDMVETLGEYSRVQQLPLQLRLEEFDLTELVLGVVEDAHSAVCQGGLRLAMEGDEQLPLVRSDPGLVRLMLLHLLLHASGRQHPAGAMRVILSADEEVHRVTIDAEAPSAVASAPAATLDPSAIDPSDQAWPPMTKFALIVVHDMATALGGRMEVKGGAGGFGAVTLTIPSVPSVSYC